MTPDPSAPSFENAQEGPEHASVEPGRMLEAGTLIDAKYRILRKIGEGGMGAVFEGEAVRIHRRVAIKVMLPGQDAEQLARRFQLEAQAAGRIGSNHIVEVLDLGALETGEQFMVMEFLEGESMRSRLARVGRVSPAELIAIVLQLLDGLSAAHSAGIVHRDLKPDNVFLVKQPGGDFVKLLDFGVSKFSAAPGATDLSLTRTGAVLGTPYYMSPEQASGKPLDHRSDLYAVGVILYEGLAGCVPFTGETFNELLFKIVLEKPHPLREHAPGLDERLYAIVERSMARSPEERFQSAAEMHAALAAWVPGGLTTLAQSRISHVAPPGRASTPSVRPNTLGNWAKSQAEEGLPTPDRGRSVRWIAAGATLALALAGTAFFLFKGSNTDSNKSASVVVATERSAGSLAAAPAPTAQERAPTVTPSELPAEPTSVPPVTPTEPERASEPAARSTRPTPTPARARGARPVTNPPPTPVRAPEVAAAPLAAVAPPPAPTPTPAPAPPPPPAPKESTKDEPVRTQTGRYIRSDL